MDRRQWTDEQVEQAMGSLLRFGVILGAAVVLVGGVMYVARHGRDVPNYATFHAEPGPMRSLVGTIQSAASWDELGIIQLGVLLLIATPVARVVLSIFAFAQQRDLRYVIVTLLVLAVLIFSLVHGYREQAPEQGARVGPPAVSAPERFAAALLLPEPLGLGARGR